MHANSLKAFTEYKVIKATQEQRVLHALTFGQITRREIAQWTGIETSSVAGRVNKLINDGKVVEIGNTECPHTGKTVAVLALVSNLTPEERDCHATRIAARVGAA